MGGGTDALSSMGTELEAVPHAVLYAGEPGTVSRSFVLLVNQAEQVATGRTESRPGTGGIRTARGPATMRPEAGPKPPQASSTVRLQSRVGGS